MARRPKAKSVRRPAPEPVHVAPNASLIARARYTGSKEHKAERWWDGLPGAFVPPGGEASRPKKQNTSICPLVTSAERDQATGWVRAALAAGQFRFYEGDAEFPKTIWHQANGRTWFGFCVNMTAGWYKGWPIDEEERRAKFD